ncbi:hypothetical protein Nepgr_020380 [Nepenthes gracilis]|uniref:Uncharacterized protein n=1 Tax=Nepenthes gracilis TaxID=150966 RepID=A0AAD3XW06_NEPGR|nr:hypothetical protein Nepgr_020380 [Nepenthes gracilis]
MAIGLGTQDVDGPILLVCLYGFSFRMVSADAENCCWGRSLNFGWLKVADAATDAGMVQCLLMIFLAVGADLDDLDVLPWIILVTGLFDG